MSSGTPALRASTRAVTINQGYRTQRVTGQQRYAREISRRLELSHRFVPARPTGGWARSALRVWAWVQVVLPLQAGNSVVLSMTSRAPVWRRRHVLVVHDLFVLTNPEWYSRAYVWTHAPLLRFQLRSSAAVVAVSRPVADQVARFTGRPVTVAPNAPSDEFRRPPTEPEVATTLARRGLIKGEYLLVVGNRDPRKNLRLLAAAYGRLTDQERACCPLVVVGGGSPIYRGETLAWPAGTVEAGYVTDDELRTLYRCARCVVFISLAEGFGLPLVEAAAAGARSFLVSDIEVFRWICGDQARYVDPNSESSVVEGLRAEIEAPRDEPVDISRFSWDASAATIEDTCLRTAGQFARSRS
jgi:glycosyltransferase involved in cell wall biosynthesis